MSTDFSDDGDDLERLLDGQADEVRSPALWRLAGLLRRAVAPAHPHELRGEDDALAAFRAARRDPAPARRVGLGLPTVKVVAGVIAVALGSGTAAVAAGLLPSAVFHIGPPVSTGGSARVYATGSEGQEGLSAAPDSTASRLPGAARPRPSVGDRPVPSGGASVAGAPFSVGDLCTLYLTFRERERPRVLIEARFAPLVSLAGDPESVDEYCAQVLVSPSPSPTPSASASPGPSPSPSPSPSTSPEVSLSPARKMPKSPRVQRTRPRSTSSTTVSSFASTSARFNKRDLSSEGLRCRWPARPIRCGVDRLNNQGPGSLGI